MLHADVADQLCQKGYALIPNFLSSNDFIPIQTLAHSLDQSGLYRQAKIGQQDNQQTNRRIRSDKIHWLDETDNYPELKPYFHALQQLSHSLNQALFLGLNDFESHFAVYPPGSFYKKHSDQFIGGNERRISIVYYLNEEWLATDGGSLILYNHQDQIIKTILPEANHLLCFRSDLPHEVEVTQRLRYSLTGWFRVRALVMTA